MPLEQQRIFTDAWIKPRTTLVRFRSEHGAERRHNGCDISFASKFGHKSPTWTERPCDALDGRFGVLHPMQGGVGENRVERFGKLEVGGVREYELMAGVILASLPKHVGRTIQPYDLRSSAGDLHG